MKQHLPHNIFFMEQYPPVKSREGYSSRFGSKWWGMRMSPKWENTCSTLDSGGKAGEETHDHARQAGPDGSFVCLVFWGICGCGQMIIAHLFYNLICSVFACVKKSKFSSLSAKIQIKKNNNPEVQEGIHSPAKLKRKRTIWGMQLKSSLAHNEPEPEITNLNLSERGGAQGFQMLVLK